MTKPTRQDLLDTTIHIITLVRPLVAAVARHDKDLASQIRRAANSFSLNLAEGFGTQRGNERARFETALGSVKETVHGLRLAAAWGYVDEAAADGARASLDRLAGRVYGLGR